MTALHRAAAVNATRSENWWRKPPSPCCEKERGIGHPDVHRFLTGDVVERHNAGAVPVKPRDPRGGEYHRREANRGERRSAWAWSWIVAGLLACSPAPPDNGRTGADDSGHPCLLCGDANAVDDAPALVQVKDAIDQICSNEGCHGSGAGGMGLSPGKEFGTMINVESLENPPMLRVLPGDPAQSYVYVKLACDGGIPEGGCMPLGSPDPPLAKLFHDWIESGAPTQ
jgi:hypothetical protein